MVIKMKKQLVKFIVLIMIVIVICGLTGCSNKDEGEGAEKEKPAVAYVIGHTANAKWIDSTAPILQNTMIDCAENYGYASIIRVDGEPEIVVIEDLDIDEQYKNAAQERLKIDAYNKATNLLGIMDEIFAIYPEVDYLEGLRCAAASLQSIDESYTSRTIICCGSGLSTSGYMNFNSGLLNADPVVLVEMLKEREALPNLNGITVYWLGIGQTIEPQEKLTQKQIIQLESIWQTVIEASGGEFIPNDYITVESEIEQCDKLPTVSIVDIPSEQPIVFEPEILEGSISTVFEEPMILGESQIEFVGDEASYLYPEVALDTIRPIAECLIADESIKLLLIGSTAGDVTNEATIQLSQDRADAVKNSLVNLGVSEGRIISVGMACEDPWHIKNVGYEGTMASSNRKVVLIDADTELAQKIINEYN
ncbi:MAG: OmpA family protein [Eubacteriales bacterium]